MEVLLQRYFWVLNAVVVALAGLIAGKTVSSVVEARMAAPTALPDASPQRARSSSLRRTVDPKALAAMFGLSLPDSNPAPDLKSEAEEGEELVTTLNATLVATIAADPAALSLAIITDNGSRETGVYGIGDQLQSAKVTRIEERRVYLLNGGRTEILEMDGDQKTTSPSRVASIAPPRPEPDDTGEGIRKISENEYVISQAEIEKTLSNLNTIATQARIVPAFKNGVSEGFKLFSIRPGSLYAKIGVQNGDIIKRVNGYEMNSPDKALEVYQKLKEAREVSVEIERRGRTVKKSYSIE